MIGIHLFERNPKDDNPSPALGILHLVFGAAIMPDQESIQWTIHNRCERLGLPVQDHLHAWYNSMNTDVMDSHIRIVCSFLQTVFPKFPAVFQMQDAHRASVFTGVTDVCHVKRVSEILHTTGNTVRGLPEANRALVRMAQHS